MHTARHAYSLSCAPPCMHSFRHIDQYAAAPAPTRRHTCTHTRIRSAALTPAYLIDYCHTDMYAYMRTFIHARAWAFLSTLLPAVWLTHVQAGTHACLHMHNNTDTHTHTLSDMHLHMHPCAGGVSLARAATHTRQHRSNNGNIHTRTQTQILVSKHISSHWRTHMHMHIHAIACIPINQQCRYNSIGRQFARQAPSNTVMQPSSPPVIPIGMHAHAYRYGCMHIDIHSF